MARRESRPRLRINRESLATRCDICHQSDSYDPTNNRCSRCDSRTEVDLMEGSLSVENASFIVGQPTENNSLNLTSDNINIQQQSNTTARPEPFNDADSVLDRREVLLNERLPELQDTETTMDEEDLEYRLPRTSASANANTSTGLINNLRLHQGINSRLVVLVVVVVDCLIMVAPEIYKSKSTSTAKNKLEPVPTLDSDRNANDALYTQAEAEAETETEANDEEIPYKLEIDFNPEKITENPIVVLGVGNVTTLELDQTARDIVVGDKEALEVIKSSSNPRKLYLIGKAPISSGNVVIESANQTITLFYEVIENATVGGFNGQIKIISSK